VKTQTLLGATILLSITAGALAQDRTARSLPPGVIVLRDIPYVPNGHERQKLDLYLPEARPADGKPLPVIVWVHGGAWLGGSKDGCPALPYVRRGYAVASVGYRLSQHARFPAQIEDCRAAVRWLRAHAKEHGLDPDHFGAWGASAGGHLVALLGTAADVKEWDVGDHREESSGVQCVVDWFGPSDFLTIGRQSLPESRLDHDAPDSPEAKLIGGPVQQNRDKAAKASPVTYVTKGDAPFLIVHGTKDDTVPFGQSEELEKALKDAGVDVTLVPVEGAGHGGGAFNAREVKEKMERFFDSHLGGKRQPEAPSPKSQ
jgi:acetyl esterase/lipase